MAKKKVKKVKEVVETPQEEAVEEVVVEEASVEEGVEEVKKEEQPVVASAPCPDCTVLIDDGGKSEFGGKGGVKPGLINPNTHCPNCEGHGVV